MLRVFFLLLAALTAGSAAVRASNVAVVIDVSEATAVLDAVKKPQLTYEQALVIARLPGSEGLIRKSLSYDLPASETLFAQALVAAAHHAAGFQDVSRFRLDAVRDHAGQTAQVLAQLRDPKLHLLPDVEARVALFTPAGLSGTVTGHLVLGGTSYGFAFGDPQMYLDLEHVPSAVLASTILEHELFHAVQSLAQAAHPASARMAACLTQKPPMNDLRMLFNALEMEGTASYVGDLLALPGQGLDEPTTKERAEFADNVDQVNLHITQMELSVHGLATGAAVTFQQVYAAGFYGDQQLYGLGYVMAHAIAREQGNGAIAELIARPGATFVLRYVGLKGYGKGDEVPALDPETVLGAQQVDSCSSAR